MHVRGATPEDAEAIAGVHVRSWRSAYSGIVDDVTLDALNADDRVAGLRAWLESDRWHVLDDGTTIVGFANTRPSRDDDAAPGVAEVTTIYLDPGAWGRGGGRMLLERVVAELREHQFTAATLWVLDANERGRRFYEALGWAPDGARKTVDVGSQTLTEVRYRLLLEDRS